jgi:5-(carboxyamino)imidazole ribonucleotide mutase
MVKAIVGIVMGSDSDLPIMKEAAEILEEFQIPYEMTIISAHRTPERAIEYAKTAEARGLKLLIAGAGGAAHLPGVLAAMTVLPVIGVPIKTSTLNGVDSLYSIVQMPRGIPVATVAINGAKNGAILGAQILGVGDPEIREKMRTFKEKLGEEVRGKGIRLEKEGFRKYMSNNI